MHFLLLFFLSPVLLPFCIYSQFTHALESTWKGNQRGLHLLEHMDSARAVAFRSWRSLHAWVVGTSSRESWELRSVITWWVPWDCQLARALTWARFASLLFWLHVSRLPRICGALISPLIAIRHGGSFWGCMDPADRHDLLLTWVINGWDHSTLIPVVSATFIYYYFLNVY